MARDKQMNDKRQGDGGIQRKNHEDADYGRRMLKLATLAQDPVLVSNMANALSSVGMIITENET